MTGGPDEAAPAPLLLADGFDVLDRAAWADMAAGVLNRRRPPDRLLNGEQAEQRLRTTTVSGVTIEALYTRPEQARPLGRPGVMPFVRGSSARPGAVDAWQVRQLHDDPDVAATHRHVLTDLERGATALWLRLGADALAVDDLPGALEGVLLDLAPVHVSSHDDQLAAARALLRAWEDAGHEGFAVAGGLGLDRLGAVALGHAEPSRRDVVRLVRHCLGSYPSVRSLTVDASLYHDAGGGEVEELACAVATGVAYLRGLEDAGVSVAQTFSQVEFRVAATADQFLTIAKLRALRRLWARVGEVSGVPDVERGARQHAVTSPRMLSRADPWVNILRCTTATFAAAVGGAEAVTVLPYDHSWGLPVESSRRIARNTQVLLAEESNLGRVTDPGGGGWYVEALTDQLAERAWTWFQQLDADGGMERALQDGRVTERVAEVREERDRRLATRAAPLTGVSTFPPATEQPLDRRERLILEPVTPPLLPPTRDAEVFEALRWRAERAAAAGHPVRVLLACLGTRRDFGARETFTSNLLHVAGVETLLSEGGTPEQVADRAHEAGVTAAVLCSSAGVYAEQGVATAEALHAAGIRPVLLAGRTSELGPDVPEDVVDGRLHDGMDVVTFLSDLLDTLGAPA